MSIEDLNEPAFPIVGEIAGHQFAGLSMRDYFASKALTGMAATLDGSFTIHWGQIAIDAYKAADAMLAERSKP